VLFLSISPVRAESVPVPVPVSLQYLLDGATITSGDKVFSGFHDFTTSSTGSAPTVLAAQIGVTPTFDNGEYGLVFNAAVFGVGSGQSQDVAFHFLVRPAPGFLITDNTLEMGAAHVSGPGVIRVIEDAYLPGMPGNPGILLAHKMTEWSQNSHIDSVHTVYSQPASLVEVHKHVSLVGGDGGSAGFSDFNQTFSQTVIPEPVTMLGLLLSVGGVAGYIRRRRMA
jgi:hypothetical protein